MRIDTAHFRTSESGTAMIEFCLFVPLLIFIFVAVVDYGMELQQAMQVTEAAAAGAAYGTVPGNQKDFAGMQTAAKAAAAALPNLNVTAVNLWTCTPGGAAVTSASICSGYGTPIQYVQVHTTATVTPLLAYVGLPASTPLQGTATFRVPWTP